MSTGVLISKSEQIKTVPPHCVVDTVVSYYCIHYSMWWNSLYIKKNSIGPK